MRAKHVATALAAVAAGMTAAATLRRFAGRRRAAVRATVRATAAQAPRAAAPAAPRVAVAAPLTAVAVAVPSAVADDAVVLPFPRRPIPGPLRAESAKPAAPARCGDNGGRTKSGAPCAARATSGGRCHHHRLTA